MNGSSDDFSKRFALCASLNATNDETHKHQISTSERKAIVRQLLLDFQEPLTVITVTAELANYRDLDQTSREDFDNILNSAMKLHEILSQVRDYLN